MDIKNPVQNQDISQLKQGGVPSPSLDIFKKDRPNIQKIEKEATEEKVSRVLQGTDVRTMQKDITGLKKKGYSPEKKPEPIAPFPVRPVVPLPTKKAVPPKELPIVESIKKPPVFPRKEPASFLETKKEEKPSLFKRYSKLLMIVIILVALIITGALLYSFFTKEPTHFVCQDSKCIEVEGEGENQCQADTDCSEKEPVSLIQVDKTEIVDLTVGSQTEQKTLLQLIEETAEKQQTKGSLTRVLVKLTNESGQVKYTSLSQLSILLGTTFPQELIDKDYTLYIYIPQRDEMEICQENSISDEKCFGPRLGLAIKTDAKELIRQWESTMFDDLKTLILADLSAQQPAGFEDDKNSLYQENAVRYQNLFVSPIALNYGFAKDLLIIGTSKYCLYDSLDRLK